jgi:serine/threonine protein kinase
MAPEQADAALGPVGPRTDVHGLGAVLYALLAGRPPYQGDARGAALAALRPDVPADVTALCERCLERDPGRRPATAAEVGEALRAEVR